MVNTYVKGVNFERRIKRYLEYYGDMTFRCADSKPVDLIWVVGGHAVLIECKNANNLVIDSAVAVLRGHCEKSRCAGLLFWQDAQTRVHIYFVANQFGHYMQMDDMEKMISFTKNYLSHLSPTNPVVNISLKGSDV